MSTTPSDPPSVEASPVPEAPHGQPPASQPPAEGKLPRNLEVRELRYTNRLTLLGFLLSVVLQYVHAKTYLSPSADSFCSVGQTLDCAAVAASKYSVVLGLPWATWGVLAFGVLLAASLMRSWWLLPLSAAAAAISFGLLLVSWLGIGSLCLLCEGVHLVSWLLFALVWRGRSSLAGAPWNPSTGSTLLLPAAGLAVGLVAFLPHYWSAMSYQADPPFPTGVTDAGHPWIGAEEPETTIEEFVDYACPHCKAVSAHTLARLSQHPDWRVIRRHQPRMSCEANIPSTCRPLRAAQCAAEQVNFWRADRWLFAHQDPAGSPDLQRMASDLGIDAAQLTSCYDSKAAFEHANQTYKQALRERVRFVPVHKVNGKKVPLKDYLELVGR